MERQTARWTGDAHEHPPDTLVVDCDVCRVRGDACADCVVTCLLGGPPQPVELDDDELGALGALAGSGMLPPLRLVTAVDAPPSSEQQEEA
jgi:hypothetical protein